MKKMSEYIGNLMPVEQFIEYVRRGYLIDYDGSGTMFDVNENDIGGIHPSDIQFPGDRKGKYTSKTLKEICTHVVWCNK